MAGSVRKTKKPSRKALVNATRGVLRELELVKYDFGSSDPVFLNPTIIYRSETGQAQVAALLPVHWENWYSVVDRYYEHKISSETLKKKLADIFNSWGGVIPNNSSDIDSYADDLLDELDRLVQRDYALLVPLSGLSIKGTASLPVATAELAPGSEKSRLAEQIRYWEEKQPEQLHQIPLDSSYAQLTMSGDTKTSKMLGLPRLEDALAILRTMLLSRSGMQYQIDLAVSPRRGFQTTFWEQSASGHHGQNNYVVGGLHPIALDKSSFSILEKHGLSRFSAAFISPFSLFAQSKVQATRWFSNGIVASRNAEAFIAFTIAIEALLGTGRANKHALTKRVAAVLIQTENRTIEPESFAIPMRFSTSFYNTFYAKPLPIRREAIQKRFRELYKVRNDISHGGLTDERIDQLDLIDLETLARAIITTVVVGSWSDKDAFQQWLKKQTSQDKDKT